MIDKLPETEIDKIFTKWVAALRSGKYKQCRTYLKYGNAHQGAAYCCLGVLCEIMEVKNEKQLGASWPYDRACAFVFGENKDLSGLPYHIAKSLGMDVHGRYNDYVGQNSLAALNDSGSSFEKIADVIEKNKNSITNHS